jgi:hypothetical protein
VALCPTAMALSGLPPTTLNPAPVMLADAMLTVAVPVFVMLRVWLALFPTETFPKLRVLVLGVKIPAPGVPGLPP